MANRAPAGGMDDLRLPLSDRPSLSQALALLDGAARSPRR
jgi:hypothetical protein